MKKEKQKKDYLQECQCLNTNALKVKNELFMKNDFFDPLDLIQVKYEMLRKVRKENSSVNATATLFGMSRQNYYKVKNAFEKKGMLGLLTEKRGPQQPFKLKDDIVNFVNQQKKENPWLSTKQITKAIKNKFDVTIHPRTIERMNKSQKKNSWSVKVK